MAQDRPSQLGARDALVRLPSILDAVEPVVGPDIMVMSADIWRKEAGETRHISFHQDAGYWSLDPPDIVTEAD